MRIRLCVPGRIYASRQGKATYLLILKHLSSLNTSGLVSVLAATQICRLWIPVLGHQTSAEAGTGFLWTHCNDGCFKSLADESAHETRRGICFHFMICMVAGSNQPSVANDGHQRAARARPTPTTGGYLPARPNYPQAPEDAPRLTKAREVDKAKENRTWRLRRSLAGEEGVIRSGHQDTAKSRAARCQVHPCLLETTGLCART